MTCPLCDNTGYKDHAGFAMDPCDCTALLTHQNTGRWNMSVEHDRRTCGVLSGNQDLIRAALKENTDD